jgi:AcrR family transcriptional regulator
MGRGSRRSVEVRREEILGATIEVVDKVGLANTRVADVAAALGVSPALVFYHFGSKDVLLAEAFEHAVDRDLVRLDTALAKDTGAMDRLRRVLRLYGPTGQAGGWRLWIDAWALAQREPVIRRVLRRLNDRWCAALRRVVAEGVEQEVFSCPDPDAAVSRVSALLDGLSVACLVYRTVSRAQLHTWIDEAVAAELSVPASSLGAGGHVTPASGRRTTGR